MDLATALGCTLIGFLILFMGIYIGGELRQRKIEKMFSGDIHPTRLSTADGVYTTKVKVWVRAGQVDGFVHLPNSTEGPWPF